MGNGDAGHVTSCTLRRHRLVTRVGYHDRMTNHDMTTMDDREGAVDEHAGALDGLVLDQRLPLPRLQQPESRLALAVLEDAAETLRTTHGVATERARRLASETWTWVESSDSHYPFTFRAICQQLE